MDITPVTSHFTSLTTRDFDQLAVSMLRWDHRFRQIGRGPFQGEIQLLRLGKIQIYRVALNRRIHALGSPPAGCFVFTPIVPGNEGSVWRGRHLKHGQMRVNCPGQEMDHVTADDYRSVSLVVEGDHLRQSASAQYGFDFEECLAGREAVVTAPARWRELRAYLGRVLDRAATCRKFLAHPGTAQQVEQECLRRCLGAIVFHDGEGRDSRRPSDRNQLVRRADEFALSQYPETVTVLDLCLELGVSERTLHYAFQEARGLSPMAYFKTHRLNAVRRELKQTDARGWTIHEIAGRWGFRHTGEFAALYRRLFGELPSETLRGGQSEDVTFQFNRRGS